MFAACACGSAPDKGMVSKTGEIEKEWVEEGVTKNYVFARGIGAADQTLEEQQYGRYNSSGKDACLLWLS